MGVRRKRSKKRRKSLMGVRTILGYYPFKTAVPFWGQTTWNLTGLSHIEAFVQCNICAMKRGDAPQGVEGEILLYSATVRYRTTLSHWVIIQHTPWDEFRPRFPPKHGGAYATKDGGSRNISSGRLHTYTAVSLAVLGTHSPPRCRETQLRKSSGGGVIFYHPSVVRYREISIF